MSAEDAFTVVVAAGWVALFLYAAIKWSRQ
jgi:hypothetical protein